MMDSRAKIGQFMFISGGFAGLEVSGFVFNSARLASLKTGSKPDITVDLKLFEQGRLMAHHPAFATVPAGQFCEISPVTCDALRDQHEHPEMLIVAECSISDLESGYLPLDGQVIYANKTHGKFTSVLYDTLPVATEKSASSPFILLDHKIWLGRNLNASVAFNSALNFEESRPTAAPITISVLDQAGTILYSDVHEPMAHGAWVFNVGKALSGLVSLADEPQFFNLVAKGGGSPTAILTFMVNSETGNIALEHSLPPHYYVGGARDRIRHDALNLS